MRSKKILAAILFFTSVCVFRSSEAFAQSSSSHLIITGGTNFLLSKQKFGSENVAGYNFGIYFERSSGSSKAIGGEINYSRYPAKIRGGNIIGIVGLMAYIKLQDNSIIGENNIQPYFKGGAGFGIIGDKQSAGHPAFPLPGLAFSTGGGANYLLSEGRKIFIESSYRYFPTFNDKHYHSVFINAGLSIIL